MLVRWFKGRPVKDTKRVGPKIKVSFLSPAADTACEKILVTEREWREHSLVEYRDDIQTLDQLRTAKPPAAPPT